MKKRNIQKTDIGNRLWQWMMKNPMGTDEIAKKIGICRGTLTNIIREKYEPRIKIRCLIEKFLHDNRSNY